jgi:hypothetical protein
MVSSHPLAGGGIGDGDDEDADTDDDEDQIEHGVLRVALREDRSGRVGNRERRRG